MTHVPRSLHTLHFHLLTVEELREHRSFWIKVVKLSDGKHQKLAEAAMARLDHVHDWLFFRRWREERRCTYPPDEQMHKRLGRSRAACNLFDAPTLDDLSESPEVQELEVA